MEVVFDRRGALSEDFKLSEPKLVGAFQINPEDLKIETVAEP
jgi:hypothetical protein